MIAASFGVTAVDISWINYKKCKTVLQGSLYTGRPYEIATKEIFTELNWQPLADRWAKNKLTFMHKVKRNELPASR